MLPVIISASQIQTMYSRLMLNLMLQSVNNLNSEQIEKGGRGTNNVVSARNDHLSKYSVFDSRVPPHFLLGLVQ